MCGIVGWVCPEGGVSLKVIKQMTEKIFYRGPDGEGHWVDADATVGLGHRRLAILDLTEAASQPMHYLDRYTIVFNGEIYNFIELRKELIQAGYSFRTSSDTEVIAAAYAARGIDFLQDLDGMFSFAIFDNQAKTLLLARDRFGEKPLYLARTPSGGILFGSEMKCLWTAGVSRAVNEVMLYNYIAANYLENPEQKTETFYRNITKVPPAHYALIDTRCANYRFIRYWDIDMENCNQDISVDEAVAEFYRLFMISLRRRLRSDVPVGSCLSGGLDSSAIVCTVDKILETAAYKTFSAQFPGYVKNEALYQEAIIKQCRVEPHFIYPSADSMLSKLNTILYHQEEPIGHASVCAQYEVFSMPRDNGVTVLLDGQGADELLGGYHHYFESFFRGLVARPEHLKSERKAYLDLHSDNQVNVQHQSSWRSKLKGLIPAHIQDIFLGARRRHFSGVSLLRKKFVQAYGQSYVHPETFESLGSALYFETMNSGLELLLRYGDRNSMAHSCEVRLPFLSHELAAFTFSLPDSFKIRNGWTKWVLRKAFEQTLPQEILWRKDKVGYEPPQTHWLQTLAARTAVVTAAEILADHGVLSTNSNTMSDTMKWKVLGAANALY